MNWTNKRVNGAMHFTKSNFYQTTIQKLNYEKPKNIKLSKKESVKSNKDSLRNREKIVVNQNKWRQCICQSNFLSNLMI